MATELGKSEEIASELAIRLAPLGRTFARAHVATQLVHAALAARRTTELESHDVSRLRWSARRIERAAATSTAMLGLAQAGLATELGGTLLRDLASAAVGSFDEPVLGGDEITPALPATWRTVFADVRPDPLFPPDLEDIGDAALAPSASRSLIAEITPSDARALPVVLAAVSAGYASAPRTSALAVRAVLDGNASRTLHWSLQLSRSCRSLNATIAREKIALELAMGSASHRTSQEG